MLIAAEVVVWFQSSQNQIMTFDTAIDKMLVMCINLTEAT